jgi:serine/threonine-protein kinase
VSNSTKRALRIVLALAVITISGEASAEDNGTTPGALGAQAVPSNQEQAQQLGDQAFQAYGKGDYPKAIELYLSSYKLAPTAEVLFNVASIYDKKLGEAKVAVEFYRRHNAAPDAKPDLVAKATVRIAALNAPPGDDAKSGPSVVRSPSADAPTDPGKGWRIAGLVTGGVGVVGLGVGVLTGALAKGKHSDATAAGCAGDTCPDAASQGVEKDAAGLANISTVTFIVGGALLVSGAAMYFMAPKRPTATALRMTPSVDLRGGGVAITGTFF